MRKIEKKMIDYLDAKLSGNGSAQQAIRDKNARELFVYACEACVGVRESGGNNKGPLVSLIQDTVGGPDAWAWCMSFMQTALAYAEVKTGVRSPLSASEGVTDCWNTSPVKQRVKIFPARGAIICWRHGKGPAGHTGVFLESLDGGKTMSTVEGNTEGGLDSKGKVERDGGGVYRNKRSMKANGTMVVVGFLKPF